jgi:3-hydroxybutyrate dehydrogenase
MYAASKHAINGFVRSLAPLEAPAPGIPRIRVNAVAPGIIKTPLWTDHAEKMKIVNEKGVRWVTPEFVAGAMVELVEKDENVGGTVLEVTKDNLRRVEEFNDPGPPNGDGGAALSPAEATEAAKKVCQTIWDVLEPRVEKART